MEKQDTTPAPKVKADNKSPDLSSKKRTRLLIGLGAFILLLLIASVSYFAGTKNQPEQSHSPSPSPSPETSTSPGSTPGSIVNPSPSPSPNPSPSPAPVSQTQTLKSQAGHDGFRSSNAGGNDSVDIRAGRNSLLITRGFLSFKIEDLPSNITVEQAKLKVYQTSTTGNPYMVGIRVMVDHLDYGDSLEHADYSSPSISSSFATLSNDDTTGWKEIDVTDQVKNDLNNARIRSQFRLHFATETTGGTPTGDFAYFESGDNYHATNNLPELIIKYH